MRVRFHLGAALVAAAVVAVPASAQDVRYTLAPAAEYTWWDKDMFLEDATLYGLRFGADFGRLIGVNLYYHRRNDLGVRLSESGLLGPDDAALPDITSDYSTFGGNVAFKLGTGKVVPFAHAGAGVVRFDPSMGKRIELINYRYGGGLQTDLARNIRGQVFVEDSRLHFDPIDFTDQDRPAGTTATRRSNWTLGVALGFALGGSLDGGGADSDNWSFASLPIEPFVGRLDWDDELLNRQTVAGIRAGVDVGTLFGLRGFYWQGRSDGLGERQPIQGYGGEAQFNLTSGLGPAPFLVAGAARLDFEEGFEDTDGMTREDETALILGGGIGIRLTDQFRLTASARDYIRSERKFEDAATLSDITHNWMLSVGLGFNLGRSRSDKPSASPSPREPRLGEQTYDRPPAAERTQAAPRVERILHVDTVVTAPSDNRVVMIPKPEKGEIYVRYGDPAGHHAAVRMDRPGTDSLAVNRGPAPRTGLTQAEMDEIVDRLTVVLENMMLRQRAEGGAIERRPDEARPAIEDRRDTPDAAAEEQMDAVAQEDEPRSGIRIHEVSPYGGLGFSPTQLVVGVRADAGRLLGIDDLRLVPQFGLGFGGSTSVLAEIGAQYNLPLFEAGPTRLIQPHVRLGVGGLWVTGDGDSQAGLNFAYGVTFDRPGRMAGDRGPRFFIEHQGIDLFDVNRFVAGLTWQR